MSRRASKRAARNLKARQEAHERWERNRKPEEHLQHRPGTQNPRRSR